MAGGGASSGINYSVRRRDSHFGRSGGGLSDPAPSKADHAVVVYTDHAAAGYCRSRHPLAATGASRSHETNRHGLSDRRAAAAGLAFSVAPREDIKSGILV